MYFTKDFSSNLSNSLSFNNAAAFYIHTERGSIFPFTKRSVTFYYTPFLPFLFPLSGLFFPSKAFASGEQSQSEPIARDANNPPSVSLFPPHLFTLLRFFSRIFRFLR